MTTVLITGASRGIGSKLAKQYAAEGAQVIACVRDTASAPGLQGANGNLRIIQMDMGDPASISAAAAAVGDQPIDVLINNAGAVGGNPAKQSLDQLDLEEWHRTLNVNTIGPVLAAKAFKGSLAASGDGKLMNVTSQLAASTWPFGGMYIYSTTKAALSKATQILALDWKSDSITVALMHPGWVHTDLGGPNAEISAEESASGIRSVIAGLTKEDSGKFYKWNGEIHPW